MEREALKKSLEGYENQLEQINNTIRITPLGDEYDTLLSLQSDMKLLIEMTRESLDVMSNKGTSQGEEGTGENMDDEYAKFMAEMSGTGAFDKEEEHSLPNQSEEPNENNSQKDVNIESELSSLEGMKCSVQYSHRWGGAVTSHNAMVCHIQDSEQEGAVSYENIKVKVMFTNPTHVEMVPCPYYLDGNCKFDDEECKYSHGEIVSLSSLGEAIEPNFSAVKPGCRVLAKVTQPDEAQSSRSSDTYLVWHRAVVQQVEEINLSCTVKLEHALSSTQEFHSVPYANILPLTDDAGEETDTDSSEDSDDYDIAGPSSSSENKIMLHDVTQGSLVLTPDRLGDWEKYTKGIGSKLMLQMGWVTGSGLGSNADGRLHPVECRITPLGKSLDHCMEIKEGKDYSKVEKRKKRKQKVKERNEMQAYEREKEKEKHNVFNILNQVLSCDNSKKQASQDSSGDRVSNSQSNIKSACCKSLNIEQFKLSEDEKRLNRDIEKLKGSMTRNSSPSSAVYRSLSAQLNQKSLELRAIKAKQSNVTKEQASRKNSNKLSIF